MGDVKGFRKAMEKMIETLRKQLGRDVAQGPVGSQTCQHCRYAKIVRGKFNCRNEGSSHWCLSVGAGATCRQFSPRQREGLPR